MGKKGQLLTRDQIYLYLASILEGIIAEHLTFCITGYVQTYSCFGAFKTLQQSFSTYHTFQTPFVHDKHRLGSYLKRKFIDTWTHR